MTKSTSLTILAALVAFGCQRLDAQTAGQTYARVLIPLVLKSPTPGAQGALWTTEFSMTNTSATHADVFPYSTSGLVCGECSQPAFPPNVTFSPRLIADAFPLRGTFLFIDRGHIRDIQFSLRVRDLSRALETWGTSLPIVEEDRFSTKTLSIIDVPTTDELRQTLRIYGLDALDPTPVQVRLYGRNENAADPTEARRDDFLGEATFALSVDMTQAYVTYRPRPAFVELQSLNAVANTAGYRRVRLDITPLGDQKKIWAFVSVTNNATQHVTILEPRRLP